MQPNDIPGHNASLAILGVFILWFGWYGFNPGSALAIVGYGRVAALAAVNTTLSAAAGTLSALLALMVLELASTGHVVWDLIGASNGTLGGLVGITAACSVVEARPFHSRSAHVVCSSAGVLLCQERLRGMGFIVLDACAAVGGGHHWPYLGPRLCRLLAPRVARAQD